MNEPIETKAPQAAKGATLADRLAKLARGLLIMAIAFVAALILTSPRDQMRYPTTLPRAYAEGGICAAPDYLLLTLASAAADKFYLVDTNKQVICVYNVTGDKLRLQSARKFDYDAIPEGAHAMGNLRLEGGNGLTRDQAKEFGDAVEKAMQNAKGKK